MAGIFSSIYCLGCGNDLTSSPGDRKSLNRESSTSTESCGSVLAEWTLLLKKELQSQNQPVDDIETLSEKGEMCCKCFHAYENHAKLLMQIKENLCMEVEKMPITAVASACIQHAPMMKRTLEGNHSEDPLLRKRSRLSSSSLFIRPADVASPPVMVNSSSCSLLDQYQFMLLEPED